MSHTMAAFTCITCRVAFNDADLQRAHYKTDWHRYNLKRKVADMPPVTAENFLQRVMTQRAQANEAEKTDTSAHCSVCNKNFSTRNQYDNHVKSKKHREADAKASLINSHQSGVDQLNMKNKEKGTDSTLNEKKGSEKDARNKALKLQFQSEASVTPHSVQGAEASVSAPEVEDADMDSDSESYEDWDGEALGLEECLFCPKVCASLENNINHMSRAHSFFVPDLDYVSDFEGLVSYLGEKVGEGHICLWCNEKSKTFLTTQAVQRHMVDKSHCKMLFEGDAVYEYSDFYDYRSSYPDYAPSTGGDMETEEDETVRSNVIEDSGYELVLPSGATIGHRTLQRYYRQNLKQDRPLSSSALTRALAQYRSLGWTGTTGVDARRRAKDINHVQRMKKHHYTMLGVKANKLQSHFRPQVIF